MEWKYLVISTVLCILFFAVIYLCSLKKERYEKFNSIMSTCIANIIICLAALLLILLEYLFQLKKDNYNEFIFLFAIIILNLIVQFINKGYKSKYDKTLIKSSYKGTIHGMLVAIIIYSAAFNDKELCGYLLAFVLGAYIDFESDFLKTIAETLKENIINIILGFITTFVFLFSQDKFSALETYKNYIIIPWVIISMIVLAYSIWKYKIKKHSKDT